MTREVSTMTETVTTEPSNTPILTSWKAFLESHPPDSQVDVSVAVSSKTPSGKYEVRMVPIQLYCPSAECNGTHWLHHSHGSLYISAGGIDSEIVFYRCRHCKKAEKAFPVYVRLNADAKNGQAYKMGEYPPFGPNTPSRVISLIGPDRDLFLKGRRAENHGLGIGAFAYYRRVVENQKNRIIDEIKRVAQRIG